MAVQEITRSSLSHSLALGDNEEHFDFDQLILNEYVSTLPHESLTSNDVSKLLDILFFIQRKKPDSKIANTLIRTLFSQNQFLASESTAATGAYERR